ncbi:MAG: AAA family ATPase [Planctomycetes bacterium]|nr:AAA family ATPase [Planctomycetota bacterium]
MPIDFPIAQLPTDISLEDAVEAVYGDDLDWLSGKLRRGVSCLVECDKQLVTFLYAALRGRLRDTSGGARGLRCRYVSGQPGRAEPQQQQQGQAAPPQQPPMGTLIQLMVREIMEMVRSAEPGTVIVVPHLDLLTTTTRSGLSMEAKEVIALCYENPDVLLLGFKDPEFELPKTVESVFAAKRTIVGIPRDRLPRVILQREARKFGVESFDPFALYKYVSGLNVVRLRQLLAQFSDRLDFDPRAPETREHVFREIRDLTRGAELDVPKIDLRADVGGYAGVKERIEKDILSLLRARDALSSVDDVKRMEELIPRGMIFEGPPGTGKTYFAKAIATAIDATAIVVSGPELKSKWVGESESNLRSVFTRARRSAPAIVIFDELDSFAVRRGSYTGSGVEHSMVNQLLTEMDGFRKEELVFVIGTTNFVESLDEALLRPGRFELKIRIPYPKEKDRREILGIYAKKFGLDLPEDVFDYVVRKTSGYVNAERRTRFTGDHLYAICRGLAREKVRRGGAHTFSKKDVDEIIGDAFELKPPSKDEEKIIATHECGHALVAALVAEAARPDKVTIEGEEDEPSAFYTRFDVSHQGVVLPRPEVRARIAVSLGGRVAEEVVYGQPSAGAADDLYRATQMARAMVEAWGMGSSQEFCYEEARDGWARRRLSNSREEAIDRDVDAILNEEKERVRALLTAERATLEAMAALLVEKRALELKELKEFFAGRGHEVDWRDAPRLVDKVDAAAAAAAAPAAEEVR